MMFCTLYSFQCTKWTEYAFISSINTSSSSLLRVRLCVVFIARRSTAQEEELNLPLYSCVWVVKISNPQNYMSCHLFWVHWIHIYWLYYKAQSLCNKTFHCTESLCFKFCSQLYFHYISFDLKSNKAESFLPYRDIPECNGLSNKKECWVETWFTESVVDWMLRCGMVRWRWACRGGV